MHRLRKIALFSLFLLLLSSTSTQAADPIRPPIPVWLHVTQNSSAVPLPSASTEQTASLVLDIDNNGINDFVIGARKEPGPSLVWYRWEDTQWVRYLIDNTVLDIEAGGAYHDIDGDGDFDIVMGGDSLSNQVWWWENPAPNFSPGTPWTRRLIKNSGQNMHHDQLFGDFDSDGVVELIFWNQASTNPNNPEARLMLAEIPTDPKTSGPWRFTPIYRGYGEGIASGDIDRDGALDIIAGGHWFKHQGGTTYNAIPIDDDYNQSRVAVGDLNGDGRLDIVLSSGDNVGPLSWYTCSANPLNGGCWRETKLIDSVDHGHSLEVVDINNDGALDIFTAEMRLNGNNGDAKMWAFYGHGDGTFTENEISESVGVHEARLADLNGDGRLDILGKPYNWQTPRLDLWFNVSLGLFADWERTVIDADKGARAVFVEAADLNKDGWRDIVTGAWWYENPGGAGAWTKHKIGEPLNDMTAVADFDKDGDLDILGSQGQGSSLSKNFAWAQNDGSGNFTIRTNIESVDTAGFLQGAVVTDVDKNGVPDVILSWNANRNGIQALTPASSPTSGTWTLTKISDTSLGEEVDAADIDRDGDIDVLLGTVWLENDDGTWKARTLFNPPQGEADRVQLADMDRDGDLDAVIGYGHGSVTRLAWYEQPDNPRMLWKEHVLGSLVSPLSLDVVDFDRDGDLDVLTGEHDLDEPAHSRTLFYENRDGKGKSWLPHVVYVGDEHHDGTQVADMDRDGDFDIISIGWTHGRVLLYENTHGTEPAFYPPGVPSILDFPFQMFLPKIVK